MSSYLIRRLLAVVPTVVAALSLLFVLFFLLPGDPARTIAGGDARHVDPAAVARVESRYGLDQPLPVQFARYWGRTLRWDLGDSYLSGRSVNDIVGDRAVNSVRLGIWAIAIEIVVGVGVGVLSAVRRRSLGDRAATLVTAAMAAVPVFVLGFLLKFAFAIYPNRHGWPSALRLHTQGLGPDSWAFFIFPTGDQWRYLVLPAVTLASVSTAVVARVTRGAMLEVLRADFLRTARAKGLRERQVVWRHALRNALLPVVTLIGLDLGAVFGSAVLTETVFSWPGVGSELARSVLRRDMPVLLGLTIVVVLAYALVNLVVDLSYGWIDPRVSRRSARQP
jgi:ABC-type dipeptide/oligopeptide/nickel transport system permease component